MVNNDFELLSNLLQRLRAGGYAFFFSEAIPPQDAQDRARLWPWLEKFEKLTSSPILTLCFQMKEVHAAFKMYGNLEAAVLEERTKTAHRNINTIDQELSSSSQAASDAHFIQRYSLLRNLEWTETFQNSEHMLNQFIQELLAKELVRPKDLTFAQTKEIKDALQRLWFGLTQAVRNVYLVIRSQVERYDGSAKAQARTAVTNLQMANVSEAIDLAALQNQFQQAALQFYSWLQHIDQLQKLLLPKSHESILLKKDPAMLLANNKVFAERFAHHLIAFGEHFEDAQKFQKNLLEYAGKHQVLCQDILDNELEKLGINLSQESVLLARQELRLNDLEFPLSIAHREWVLKVCSLPRL